MNPTYTDTYRKEKLPVAGQKKSRATWFFWLIPIAAALFVGWLIYSRTFGSGPTVYIRFPNAAGLQAGKSQVKFRGAVVGSVEDIKLAEDQQSVDVEVQISKGIKNMAREGAEFWIVKPEISAAQISGLRTIVSGSYIGVNPGHGAPKTHFIGVPQPWLIERERPGVEFVLLSASVDGAEQGTPVFYRGIRVGEVTGYRLGPDSQTIEIAIDIAEPYAPLVREDSKFWNVGGVKVNVGLLSGIDISVRSLKTLLQGGIAFATPEPPGKRAMPRTPFRLYEKPEDAWLAWMPRISLTNHPTAATSLHK